LQNPEGLETYVLVPPIKGIQFSGTKTAINNALQKGIIFVPSTRGQGTLTFTVNDNGNFGAGSPLASSFTLFVSITDEPQQPPQGAEQAAVGAAMVGVTTLVSLSLFGAYKIMKRRKLIPEEADPWENDELFDATLENPIYSGATITMNAVYDDDSE